MSQNSEKTSLTDQESSPSPVTGNNDLEKHPNLSTDVGPPPDGGRIAWQQVFAAHLINSVTWGYVTGFGVFQTHYEHSLQGVASSDISWIGGLQAFCLFFVGVFAGRATDAGYGRHTVFIGSIFLVVGTFMTSLCKVYWQVFLAQGVCVGLGLGLIWLPTVAILSSFFKRKRVLAVTSAAAGTGPGSIIFPIIIQYLTPKIGFPWAVRVMAFIVLTFAIIFNSLLRTRLPPRRSGPLVEWNAFTEPPYVFFCIGVFLLYWAVYFAFFYIQSFARSHLGFSDISSVNLIITINAVGIPIRPILGYCADRWWGPLNTLIPVTFIVGILLFAWLGISSAGGLYAFAVIYGLAAGAAMSLFVGTVPSLTDDLSKVGTRVGMVVTIMSFAPLTGPSIGGALIHNAGGSYTDALIWGGISVIAGAVALVGARIAKGGRKLIVKL